MLLRKDEPENMPLNAGIEIPRRIPFENLNEMSANA